MYLSLGSMELVMYTFPIYGQLVKTPVRFFIFPVFKTWFYLLHVYFGTCSTHMQWELMGINNVPLILMDIKGDSRGPCTQWGLITMVINED